jgi:hypothetical protein
MKKSLTWPQSILCPFLLAITGLLNPPTTHLFEKNESTSEALAFIGGDGAQVEGIYS